MPAEPCRTHHHERAGGPEGRRSWLGSSLARLLAGGLLLGGCEPVKGPDASLSAVRAPAIEGTRVRMLLAGDLDFGESYREQITAQGGGNVLEMRGCDGCLENLAPLMRDADLVVANLETVITGLARSPFAGRKEYLHWTDPGRTPAALKRHGVTAVSLANNHGFDFGLPPALC